MEVRDGGRKDDERKIVTATMLIESSRSNPFSSSPSLHSLFSTLSSSPSTDYEKVITHYIQLYRYNDALKVLTEKASEALQHGSEAVGRDGGREGGGERGREGGRRWKGLQKDILSHQFYNRTFHQ